MTERLPRKCECGGKMQYAHTFSLVFSVCLSCTPVTKIKWDHKTQKIVAAESSQTSENK